MPLRPLQKSFGNAAILLCTGNKPGPRDRRGKKKFPRRPGMIRHLANPGQQPLFRPGGSEPANVNPRQPHVIRMIKHAVLQFARLKRPQEFVVVQLPATQMMFHAAPRISASQKKKAPIRKSGP